jgi:hypothetical protein
MNGLLHLVSHYFEIHGQTVEEESLLDPEFEDIKILRKFGYCHPATQRQIAEYE